MKQISRTKTLMLAMLALVALAAVASTSASAAEWHVNGSPLVGKAAISKSTHVTQSFVLTGGGVVVTCTGLNINGGEITSPNTNAATSLEFTGCSGGKNCIVTKTITTNPVKSLASLGAGNSVNILFEPTSGTVFVTIHFEGALCALEGNQPVKGKATVKATKGQLESAQQPLEANTPTGELQIGGNNATLKGAAEIDLASGLPFSFK